MNALLNSSEIVLWPFLPAYQCIPVNLVRQSMCSKVLLSNIQWNSDVYIKFGYAGEWKVSCCQDHTTCLGHWNWAFLPLSMLPMFCQIFFCKSVICNSACTKSHWMNKFSHHHNTTSCWSFTQYAEWRMKVDRSAAKTQSITGSP